MPRQRETMKTPLFAFMFFKEIIEKPNFNHHNKIQSLFYDFFVHIVLPSVDTTFCSSLLGLSAIFNILTTLHAGK